MFGVWWMNCIMMISGLSYRSSIELIVISEGQYTWITKNIFFAIRADSFGFMCWRFEISSCKISVTTPNTMEVTGILLVVFKALKNYNWKTWEERLFLERMSRLLWIIHRPHCGTVFIGTTFYWRNGPSEVCGLASVTRTLFSGKSCCCRFFQMCFFFSVLWTTKIKIVFTF